jgi:hypothetical protein
VREGGREGGREGVDEEDEEEVFTFRESKNEGREGWRGGGKGVQ